VRLDSQYSGDKAVHRGGVLGVALRQNLNPCTPVRGNPVSGNIRRNALKGYALGLQQVSQLIQGNPQRLCYGGFGLLANGGVRFRKSRQQAGERSGGVSSWALSGSGNLS
jgi:hypothetical protein